MQEPNISPYRRAVCGDLTTAFNFKTPNLLPVAELDGKKTKAEADAIRVARFIAPSSCSEPATISSAGNGNSTIACFTLYFAHQCQSRCHSKTVKLMFSNTGKQAAVFHVYNRLDLTAIPRRYMVEAGKQLDDVEYYQWTV